MVVIDKEFQALIPPLSIDEKQQLEANLVADGCRDPLVIWNGILIDGHNRFEICNRLDIGFETVEMDFESRDAVCDWIDSNQLGRRNLHPDQMSLLRGRIYNRSKKAAHDGGKGKQRSGDQNDPNLKTAEKVAAKHGVSPATIKRDGKFAEAVEKVARTKPSIINDVAAGKAPAKSAVIKAAELIEHHPEKANAIIRGEIKMADAVREIKRTEVIQKLESVEAIEQKKLEGKYDVIVIDPPWPMDKIERGVRPNQVAFEYPVMQESELEELEMPAADDCHMWLWTTQKFLPMSLRLLEKWGFKYVCTFVWHKPGGFQPIGLPQYNCEFAIYARKGSPKFIDTKAFNVCFDAPRGAHSEKPELFYEVVRRVTAGRRIDIFNRRKIEGFDVWGKEAHDCMEIG